MINFLTHVTGDNTTKRWKTIEATKDIKKKREKNNGNNQKKVR